MILIKENWLTRAPNGKALYSTFVLGVVMAALGFFFLENTFGITQWMAASREKVFDQLQIWRLWTALFSHADVAHMLGNMILFLPLAFLLSGYFGWFVFPTLGLFLGGVINLIVLRTMPPAVTLIGMSGVVYWMGATWLTLYVLVDRRQRLRRRFALAFLITAVLFVPEVYKPEISYMSHFIGYVLGLMSGAVIYMYRRKEFNLVEVKEFIYEDEQLLGEIESTEGA